MKCDGIGVDDLVVLRIDQQNSGGDRVDDRPQPVFALAKLGRPPVSAWAVNQLYWHARDAFDRLGKGPDVRGRGAAAAAHDVDEARAREFADLRGHVFRRVVVAAEFVGQTRVGMHADQRIGHGGKLVHILAQFLGAQCAIETEGDRPDMPQGIPEGGG